MAAPLLGAHFYSPTGPVDGQADVEASLTMSTGATNDLHQLRATNVSRRWNQKQQIRAVWFGFVGFAALVMMGLVAVSVIVPRQLPAGIFQLKTVVSGSSALSTGRTLQEEIAECEETYGIMPCSSSLGGNIFLMCAYGYLLLVAARLISDGSELLLQVLNPGIIGGLLLPILGAFPDTLLIAVSGMGGSAEEAQDEVLVGMGVLAGSTIMILTLAWGGSLIFGRCDLTGPNGTAKDRTLSPGFSLFGSGVTTDEQTSWGAWIMIISVIPYIVLQFPLIQNREAQDGHTAALIGMILAFAGLVAYCTYQVMSPWLQEIRIGNARLHYIRTVALRDLHSMALSKSWGGLLEEDGSPNYDTLDKIFDHFDENNDGNLQESELKALIFGMGMQHQGSVPQDQEIAAWLQEFDKDSDGNIGKEEFTRGMGQWVARVAHQSKESLGLKTLEKSASGIPVLGDSAEAAKGALAMLEEAELEEEEEEQDEKPLTATQVYQKAFMLMLAGAIIVAVFADPMVDAIGNFSTVSGIPAFFVAFVVTPLASNASELVSSLLFAMKKRKRTISLTYSQVYGAITMNNTMCLGVFLAIVYFRGLTWQFSSEVTIILINTLLVGIVGGVATTFRLWLGLAIMLLYPFSIALVAFLDYVLGWN